MSGLRIVPIVLGAGGGLAAGAVFFALLHATVRLYTTHRWPLGIGLHLLRWAVLVTLFVVAARAGAAPLIAAAAGTLVARACLVRP
jgi:F1F0 ATPase subunit 2